MGHLDRLNNYALDGYLRGEHGESLRQEAQQVIYRRGLQSAPMMTEAEMVESLKSLGYVVFMPRHRRLER